MTTERILTDELRPGDAIVFLGTPHVIDQIDPYIGPHDDFVFGVARSGPWWAMSLESGARIDVIRGGAR